jgi:hypothetical protein
MCKPYRHLELNNNTESTEEEDNEWTISFEQLEAATNAETCLVTWLENNKNHLSLDKRINNYNGDILR